MGNFRKYIKKINTIEEELDNILEGIGDIAYKNEKFKIYTKKMILREIEKNINGKLKIYNNEANIIIHPNGDKFLILLKQANDKKRLPFVAREIQISYELHNNKTIKIQTDRQIFKIDADSGIVKKIKFISDSLDSLEK